MLKGTIDRFEEEYAVISLDDRSVQDIPRNLLPPDAQEGDIIASTAEGNFVILTVETTQRKQEIRQLMEDIWEKD